MSETVKKFLFFGIVALLVWQAVGKPLPFKPKPSAKVDAVVYIYEKDDIAVPSAVRAALNTLNKQGIMATEFEEDTVDGTGAVPDQYVIPLAAAKAAGLPSLVVSAGKTVIRTVKNPITAAQVLEAIK